MEKLMTEDRGATVAWWSKDGAWHVATPRQDGSGRYWLEVGYNSLQEAIACAESLGWVVDAIEDSRVGRVPIGGWSVMQEGRPVAWFKQQRKRQP